MATYLLMTALLVFGLMLNIGVSSNTARQGYLAIYSSGPYGLPYELITDLGTYLSQQAGNQSITIDLTLQPGIYWLATGWLGGTVSGGTMRTGNGITPLYTMMPASKNIAFNTTVAGPRYNNGLNSINGVPTFTQTLDANNANMTTTSSVPLMRLRVA
jgi:hypothetical protein